MKNNLDFEKAAEQRRNMIADMFQEIHDSQIIGGPAAKFLQSLYEFFKQNGFLTNRQFTSLELMYHDCFSGEDS